MDDTLLSFIDFFWLLPITAIYSLEECFWTGGIKLTADQVLFFDWIVGSSQVNLS